MKILTVSELTFAIKSLLEPSFRSISVKGEISNFKMQSSGHLYFSLKDAGSQISSALFKGRAAHLSRMPKEGDQVIATGEISVYPPRGQYQMIVHTLQFLGVGALLEKLQLLKEELKAQGFFDPSHKKPLPKLPKKIGVITSPTGAVIQDILNVLTRRFAGFQVILNPVKVQGEGAAEEIAKAIYDCNRYQLADVLIVGRGGGSIEDLWAFNEKIVAQAIYDSKIPIISAVGHETDTTIADLVADIRAPTPSAAAEIAISEKEGLIAFLKRVELAISNRMEQHLTTLKQHLKTLQRHPLLSSPYGVLAPFIQRLDDFTRQFEFLNLENAVQVRRKHVEKIAQSLQMQMGQKYLLKKEGLESMKKQFLRKSPLEQIQSYQDRLKRLEGHLDSLNPNNLLKKGYAIIFSEKSDSTILSTDQIQLTDKLKIRLHDGEVLTTVEKVKSYGKRDTLV